MSDREPGEQLKKTREKIDLIERTGCSISQQEMRQRLLRYAMSARVDKPAEYVVITGCRSTTGFVHLAHFVKLLKHYEVDHTFLSEETCCGNSFLERPDQKSLGDEMQALEEYARDFEGANIERVKRLGAKKIVTACAGCYTRYSHFQVNGDIDVLYYTQLLKKYVDGIHLSATIDFYEGCHKHHRTPTFKIDTKTSRSLLEGVEALDFSDIPNYCCRDLADKIYAKATTDTIVTPTSCCWTYLTNQRRSDSPQVISLTQLMCQALGIA
ncbi:MAG: (Fe-S)-binding protein [Chloroflexi bacterium]|nr:(Fe-S)-binding protein [Chloroflexota bacterium]